LVQLTAVYDQIQATGAQLWAIAPQDQARNQELRERRALPFPILADADLAVIRAWGLFNALDEKQRLIPYPAAYLVGPDGRVLWRHLSFETRDRPTPMAIVAVLRAYLADAD
jgi:peroxiredoxin